MLSSGLPRLAGALVALSVLAPFSHAESPTLSPRLVEQATALRDRAMNDPLAYALVSSLTTEVGPRLAGSPGDRKAVQWAKDKLESLDFDTVTLTPVTVPHWDRGTLSIAITAPYAQPMVGTMLGGSVGTGEAGVRAEVVGVTSLDELRALPASAVEGKIVFIDQKMRRAKDGGGYSETVGIRVLGASISGEKGALACLIRSVGTDDHRTGHTGAMRYSDETTRVPAIALSSPDADMLARQLNSDQPVTVAVHSTARYLPDAISYNVIGEITGGAKKDEIVLLGAHLDSWDEGTGAIDDGAGVAIVTAAAKLIGDLRGKTKRTVRVVLFANEEFGLSGARQYLADNNETLDKHIVAMEADFGAGAVWQFGSRVEESALGLIEEIQALLAPIGIERGNNEAFGGADIGPLIGQGVPVYGFRQDGTYYFDYHHTPGDTLDKIDPKDLAQNVAAYATAAFIAADIDGDFGRLPKQQP